MTVASLGQVLMFPARVRGLASGEEGQVRYRFLAVVLILGIYLVAQQLQRFGDLSRGITGILTYASFAYLWGLLVALDIGPRNMRRFVGTLLDHGIFALGFYYADGLLAPLLWVPGSITTGNALRFGPRLGLLSLGVGALSLSVSMGLSPFWQAQPLLTLGCILANTVLPIYALSLSVKVHSAKAQAEALANRLDAERRIDPLTGVANRTGLAHSIERLAAQEMHAARHVFYIDLDGFKAVNDQAGHEAGDAVLKEAATAMRSVVRASDVVARMGGDEFVVVVGGADAQPEGVRFISDKLAAAVSAIAVPGFPHLRVRASIGVCAVEGVRNEDFLRALARADEEMLRNKHSAKRAR